MSEPVQEHTTSPASGRTWLFVPGDRPARFEKAAGSGADAVVCDLEDAVSAESKTVARDAVARFVHAGNQAWVRVNAKDTPWHDADLTALKGAPGLRGVVVPKSDDPATMREVATALGGNVPLIALVESAEGLQNVSALVAEPAVHRLAFGAIDFSLDAGIEVATHSSTDSAADPDEEDGVGFGHDEDTALLYARSALVVASRAGGLPGPIDGVTVATTDVVRVEREARRSRSLGFGGKLCIHPAQIEPVLAGSDPAPRTSPGRARYWPKPTPATVRRSACRARWSTSPSSSAPNASSPPPKQPTRSPPRTADDRHATTHCYGHRGPHARAGPSVRSAHRLTGRTHPRPAGSTATVALALPSGPATDLRSGHRRASRVRRHPGPTRPGPPANVRRRTGHPKPGHCGWVPRPPAPPGRRPRSTRPAGRAPKPWSPSITTPRRKVR